MLCKVAAVVFTKGNYCRFEDFFDGFQSFRVSEKPFLKSYFKQVLQLELHNKKKNEIIILT